MLFRALLLTCAVALPASVQQTSAQEIAVADCDTFGKITQEAVLARTDGKRAKAATRQIAKGYTGDQARFKDAVPLLVDFVYNLPEEQLSADVGTAYVAACKGES